jgi:hypothetical protein
LATANPFASTAAQAAAAAEVCHRLDDQVNAQENSPLSAAISCSDINQNNNKENEFLKINGITDARIFFADKSSDKRKEVEFYLHFPHPLFSFFPPSFSGNS